MTDATTDAMATAYGSSATAWACGPDRLYEVLARAFVAACPPVGDAEVLDVGAGTGAVSRAAQAAGGRVVAADLSVGMLAEQRRDRPAAVAADARWLPFRQASFDACLAGFVLNHLTDPVPALRELVRVSRPGGTIAAAVIDPTWDHPAKAAIDDVARRFGYRPPDWYRRVKTEASMAPPDALVVASRAAGIMGSRLTQPTVDEGLRDPAGIVAWRLGMAHLAPFVAGLPATTRDQLITVATTAVGPHPAPVRPRLVVIVGRRQT